MPSDTPNPMPTRALEAMEAALSGLGPRSRAIAECAFEHPDWTKRRVAREMGVTDCRVGQVLNHSRTLRAFAALGRRRVAGLVPKAVKLVDTVLNVPNETGRKAAERVLESEGILGAQRIEVSGRLESMTRIELLKAAGQASSIPEPSIDADVVSEGV